MKRTITTILALCGLAIAEDVTLTTGIKITNSENTSLISALNTDASNWVGSSALSPLGVGSSFSNWSGSKSISELTFSVTIADLYGANLLDTAEGFTLNTFSYLGNGNGYCEDEGRTITVAVQGSDQSVTAELQQIRTGAWLTVDTSSLSVSKDSVLTITLSDSRTSPSLSLATADIYASGATSVEWSGVTTQRENADLGINTNWSYQAPLVKLGVSLVPEPTGTMLGILTLVGLVARRRRK